MDQRRKRIVVAGDAAVDWFFFPVPGCDEGQNWQLQSSSHAAALPGGALLLTEALVAALKAKGAEADIAGPKPPASLDEVRPEEMLHSNAMLQPYEDARTLRIREALGFIGPARGSTPPRAPADDPSSADLVVLDDAGNGFRDDPAAWPAALTGNGAAPLVLHKLHRPLDPGPLWKAIGQGDSERHIAVVRADDLRCIPGVDISHSLSWERTAKDVVFQLQRAEALAALRNTPYLIVLFESDGALIHYGRDRPEATLVFDSNSPEGAFRGGIRGRMYGEGSAFVAALASRLAIDGTAELERGVTEGLGAMRNFLRLGFRPTDSGVAYPLDEVFSDAGAGSFTSCAVPPAESLTDADPHYWRVLDQKTRNTLPLVAEDVVRRGASEALTGVPAGVFGKALRTIDRAEIESYSAIRELIREFLADPKPARPLCFAVFGPPGAGKSFGVKQVVASIGSGDLEIQTFNISQFSGYGDLAAAFHQVRNVGLSGRIPFVFFDEFDAGGPEGRFAWLKSFLAPMQDAEFRDGGAVHPIGKAVFVFAGGTRSTFEEFVNDSSPDDEPLDAEGDGPANAAKKRTAEFRQAKGPDFVSRLRGFINIMGPNRQHASDAAFLIRRAMVLRGMLERNAKAKNLFDTRKGLRIDDGALRALLYVGRYRHGTRSIEAILDMSRLAGRDRFDLAALPPTDQLELHVDAQEFRSLTQQERFLSMLTASGVDPARSSIVPAAASAAEREQALVESAACKIHDDYVRQRKLEGKTGGSVAEWKDLSEKKRRSNRDAAADIPRKLRAIGHGLRPIPAGRRARTPDVTDEEIEDLARMEHARWMSDQRLQGVTPGVKPDPTQKTSPYLVPYDALPEDVRQYDVQAVMRIPAILQSMGMEIYRMEEAEALADPDLVESLARAIHDAYVAERTREGDTLETNPSMAPFDELPPDIRDANFDNAESVPRKLKRLGYDLRRVRPGAVPRRLELSEEELERLAIMEHSRWTWQKILQDWTFAPGPKDAAKKTSPHIVPWKDLPDSIRDYDRQTVRLIPDLIQKARYEAVR